MQSASHGIPRLTIRGIVTPKSRGIHIPTFIRTPPGNANSGAFRNILQHSRTFVTQFFTHLTTPGTLRVPSQSLLTRPIHVAARGHNSIRNGLSLHARTVLSRPLNPPFFPRAPAIPRGMTQVGLGTARNFSSARPIFQNLAQNVPVTGRALWEVDWELKVREERNKMMPKRMKHKQDKSGGKEMMKPKLEPIVLPDTPNKAEPVTEEHAEIDHYFPAPPVPNVMTYLLIPLAPTPTSRLPLHALPPDHRALLSLPDLADLHTSHATHSLRVSSLFARLDAANVWSRGVICSAYSHGSAIRDGEGACTILKIEFVGWTKAEVRGVIGESGTGWCVLEERWPEAEEDETSSIFSETSDEFDGSSDAQRVDASNPMLSIDPAQSFVLPTIDFSSNSTATPSEWSASEIDMLNRSDVDAFSDADWDALSQSSSVSAGRARSIDDVVDSSGMQQRWFAFSSDFASKTDAEPREYLF